MVTLHLDVELTRRMRLHHILDDTSQVLHSSAKVSDSLMWLWEQGYHRFAVETVNSQGGVTRSYMSFDRSRGVELDEPPKE